MFSVAGNRTIEQMNNKENGKDKCKKGCRSFQINGKEWICQQCRKSHNLKSIEQIMFERSKWKQLPQISK